MKEIVKTFIVAFVIIYAGFYFFTPSYCDKLKLQQYNKRQEIMSELLKVCDGNISCIAELNRIYQYLFLFDQEVLDSEGCFK
jgi:hypothetical protein